MFWWFSQTFSKMGSVYQSQPLKTKITKTFSQKVSFLTKQVKFMSFCQAWLKGPLSSFCTIPKARFRDTLRGTQSNTTQLGPWPWCVGKYLFLHQYSSFWPSASCQQDFRYCSYHSNKRQLAFCFIGFLIWVGMWSRFPPLVNNQTTNF